MSLREWWAEYTKEINTSAELINELIAITTEYDETIYNIGRETYNVFKKNQIFDPVTADLCRRIDADTEYLEKYRKDVEDFEALVQGEDAGKSVGGVVSGKVRQGANSFFLNRELSAHRTMIRDHYEEIGRRVFSQGPSDGSITNNPRIRRMVLYATHVKTDSEAKWKQIEERNKVLARGPGFHSVAANFVVGMVRFINTTFLSDFVKSAKDYQVQVRNRVKQGYKGVHYDSTATPEPPKGPPSGKLSQAPAAPAAPSAPYTSNVQQRHEELRPGNLFGNAPATGLPPAGGGGGTGFGSPPASGFGGGGNTGFGSAPSGAGFSGGGNTGFGRAPSGPPPAAGSETEAEVGPTQD